MNKIFFALLAVLLLGSMSFALAEQDNAPVIAVAAGGKLTSKLVSPQAGRSLFFLYFDSHGTFIEAVDNPYQYAGNAGIPVLDFLAKKGIKVVVAQGFGSRIVTVMK